MEVNDVDKIVAKLNEVERTFGLIGVVIVISLAIVWIITWKYLSRKTELIAEEASEKSLKKFQSKLDKELVKFQTNHQKQIDVVHEIFQKFQLLKSTN